MNSGIEARIAAEYQELAAQFSHWEVVKDLVDQLLDVILNYRQSGHPGGSRSKVHALVDSWHIRPDEGDEWVRIGGMNAEQPI